ncbi:MAG: hypothetical protein A4E42_00042 [Methanoregulaceae archaeon PtaU1.Bin222]|nr:MAG: hypothetical protein A4E42_00042 [Methanoregulaceae archaeon PtaU1.Bin222]
MWPGTATKSKPSMRIGICPADCAASTRIIAPASCAILAISSTGWTVPRTFVTWLTVTSFVRGDRASCRSEGSTKPFFWGRIFRSTPRSLSAIHGSRFAWCSSAVVITSSPSLQQMPWAAMLIASVVFFVKTRCPGSTPRNTPRISRVSS